MLSQRGVSVSARTIRRHLTVGMCACQPLKEQQLKKTGET